MEDKEEVLDGQTIIGEEKSEAIAHKDSSLKRLDVTFNKHIELGEYKKSNLLAYWVKDFAQYHDEENIFDSTKLRTFKRGDIVKANLGFRIGNELGGLHYCVVINKNDNPCSGTLNIIPLSSAKENKEYNESTCIDLGDELFCLLSDKFEKQEKSIKQQVVILNSENRSEVNISTLIKSLNYLDKMRVEIEKMKHGSIAYVHQITTISKQRIFRTPILSGIRISNESLDILDERIKKLYTK